MKVSVIMPVYNAEKCIQKSLDSIAAQTYRDFEVVFVDDCSDDGTSRIINGFTADSGIVCQVIRHEKNRGVAAARNTGIEAAGGEFLAFVDADDSIDPTALEKAVALAEKEEADIVGWDWILGFEKNGRYMRQADYASSLVALKNLMGGTMRWNLWLFLVRRELLERNGIRFIDGANMGEDMMVTLKAFACAGSVSQIHEPLYRYNAVSSSSISRQFSEERRAEITKNLEEAEKFLLTCPYSDDIKEYINYLKLYLKLPLLISPDRENYTTWYNWFPEANEFASANKVLPLRTRMLQHLASHRCWTGVKIYYLIVYRFVYGVIFK